MYYELKTITIRLKENHMFGFIRKSIHQRLVKEVEFLEKRCVKLKEENDQMHRKMADMSEIRDEFSDLVDRFADIWYKK